MAIIIKEGHGTVNYTLYEIRYITLETHRLAFKPTLTETSRRPKIIPLAPFASILC